MNLRTPMATKLLGSLALVLVAAVGWLFVLSPQSSELGEIQTRITDTRDQNDMLRLQLVSLQRQAQALGDTKAGAQALAEKFPPTADQPGLFEQVTSAAEAAGIPARDLTALTPTPPQVGTADPAQGVQLPSQSTSADLARQSVTLSVEGSYAETATLLANLETMPRAYLVTSVTVSGATDSGGFVTTIVGDMFVMPPAPEPDAPAGS